MANSVIFNVAGGEALIAGTLVVPVREAGTRGELQIDGGAILRPLTFGERTRIVTRAAVNASPLPALMQGILQTAQVQPGAGDNRRVLEILALALAGADQEAPPFMESALRVARGAGWSLAQIYDAEAIEIDRFAVYLGGTAELPQDDGWNRIVFMDSPTATTGDALDDVCRTLAERLLLRADASANLTRDIEAAASVAENDAIAAIQHNRSAENHLHTENQSSGAAMQSGTFENTETPSHSYPLPSQTETPLTTGAVRENGETVNNPSRGYIRVRTQPAAKTETAIPASEETTVPAFSRRLWNTASTRTVTETSSDETVMRSPAAPTAVTSSPVQQRAVQPARILTRPVSPAAAITRSEIAAPTLVADVRTEIAPLVPVREANPVAEAALTPVQPTVSAISDAQLDDLAGALAEKLDLEADLRGLER